MAHGLFINQRKASCSIYESGLMIKDALKGNIEGCTLDYKETDIHLSDIGNFKYDFYIINWHPASLPVTSGALNRLGKGKKICIVLEVSENEYIPITPNIFDAYMILDPTKKKKENFYIFPRPIIDSPTKPLLYPDRFVVGSFGLIHPRYSRHEKVFEEIIVNTGIVSDGSGLVRFNFPQATFIPIVSKADTDSYFGELKRVADAFKVELRITRDYMSRDDLVGWLSEHNMNSFPYYRTIPGLSAVTDQAISAERAIAVTDCATFRHVHKYISHYPEQNYLELSESTLKGVRKMKKEWSVENFRKSFNLMLLELGIV